MIFISKSLELQMFYFQFLFLYAVELHRYCLSLLSHQSLMKFLWFYNVVVASYCDHIMLDDGLWATRCISNQFIAGQQYSTAVISFVCVPGVYYKTLKLFHIIHTHRIFKPVG